MRLRNNMCKGRDIKKYGMFQKQAAWCDCNIGYRRRSDEFWVGRGK